MALISVNYLESLIGIKNSTLNVYLCRAEFEHIEQIKEGNKAYLNGISKEDIEKLKKLANRKNNRWKKGAKQ